MSPRAPAMAAAALGVAWFVASGGGGAMSPGEVGWLLRAGDPAQHWLGWSFFRNEPWRLPLGAVPGLAEPLGTSVALTDGLPLLAVLARPFSGVLPPDFQYLGPWLAACFALQGYFGARIGAALGAGRAAQVLTGALFVVAPPLLWRVGHESLSAHWILLGMIALALGGLEEGGAARRTLAAAAAFALLASAIHPTLALQALGLASAIGLSLALRGLLGVAAASAWLGGILLAQLAVLALLGYLGAPPSARGYGYFAADLLTFVNPMGWSRLLPSWPTRTPGQAEGFAYLGAGGLLLVALAAGSRCLRRARIPWRRIAPLVAVAAVFAAFAVSTYVTLGGRKLFGTSSLPAPLSALVGPFRASGRFIWPLYYTLLAGGVAGTLSLLGRRRTAAPAALAAALALQLVDLGTGRARAHFEPGPVPSLAGWEAARAYRHLALVPPRLRDGDGRGCGGELGAREIALAYRAYRLGLALNSGYLSRMDVPRALRACAAELEAVVRGELRADTVYVPEPGAVALLISAGATCGRVGGEVVCVAPSAAGALPAQLAASPR